MTRIILIILIGYLIGSLPFAYLAGKLVKGVDIRREGSKNIGATNVFRVVGILPGIAVLLLDISKGFLSVRLPALFSVAKSAAMSRQTLDSLGLLAGLSAIGGHNWSIFMKFRGGKGVATGCGVALGMAPIPALLSLAVFMVVIALTRYVSLGSIIAVLTFPLNCLLFKESITLVFFGGIVALVILVKHLDNIKRLIAGTENRIRWVRE